MALVLVATYLVEGLITAVLPAFPIAIVVGAQGAVALYYFNQKTKSDNVNAELQATGKPV
jgi:hypothetical protein